MKKTYQLILVILILLVLSGFAHAAQPIKLATLDWEPYIGQTLPDNGYVAEVIREAFKRSGYEIQMDFLPWARVVKMAREGKYDGYFPEYYSDELQKDFKVSSSFPGGPLVFFKRKGEEIHYGSLSDLKPYFIGVVRGYINTREFDEADYLKKDEATDDLTNFKKLLKKRVDLIVADKFVGYDTVRKNLPDAVEQIDVVNPPLEIKDLFLCISKKTPDAQIKLEALEKGLAEIKSDGTLERILKKHGF
ncbi:substrate-binding periplasmic protein [Desulfamplus magnetovallimortis]|nr:transporter substrate-binding domain-containing protein [Desulfamplus magnetovallimortis]